MSVPKVILANNQKKTKNTKCQIKLSKEIDPNLLTSAYWLLFDNFSVDHLGSGDRSYLLKILI